MIPTLLAALLLSSTEERISPTIVTAPVEGDPDDPALWIDHAEPARSLVLGTDKGGRLYAFDLDGAVVATVTGLARPNNVDIETGLDLGGEAIDIAVVTERDAGRIRVFRLPELTPVDRGGIAVFRGQPDRRVMGVALYRRPDDGAIFAILSRKDGPRDALLWQYRLEHDGSGAVRAAEVRRFGTWHGPDHPTIPGEGNEIEAVCVDDERGDVYYAEEAIGVHRWAADPAAPDAKTERGLFATDGFEEDREGTSLLADPDGGGVLIVSDQAAGRFRVYARRPPHRFVTSLRLSVVESDGSDGTRRALGPRFPNGLFVAMTDEGAFHYYDAALFPTHD